MLSPVADFIKMKRGKVDEYKRKLEDMLGDPENYDWAEETLTGIYDYILERDSITEKQMATVDKIKQSIYERRW